MLVCLVPVFIDLFFFFKSNILELYTLICFFFTVTEKLRHLLFISLFNIMFFKSYEIPDDINQLSGFVVSLFWFKQMFMN